MALAWKSDRAIWLLASLSFCLLETQSALGYDTSEHTQICEKVLVAYEELFQSSEPSGLLFLLYHSSTLQTFVVEEDSGLNPANHFYDPLNRDCLMQFAIETAFQRAQRYEAEYAAFYVSSNSEPTEIAERIGRILHLIADMGVPAHVHLTPHIITPNLDWYEKDYAPTYLADPNMTECPSFADLRANMDSLALTSQCFPSGRLGYQEDSVPGPNGCELGAKDGSSCGSGEFARFCWQTAPWNDPESQAAENFGAEIAEECYLGAVVHSVAYLRHFIETVAPTIDGTGLDADPDGLYAAIPPDVSAHGYGESPNQAPIVDILWWYSYEPEPVPFPSDDWVAWDRTTNQDLPVNGEAVSIRCVALDHCSVDSESRSYTISFDNTPPTIQRVQ